MRFILFFIIVLITFVSCGNDKGNTIEKDKCKDVVCDEFQQCNSLNGECETKENMCLTNSDCAGYQICNENHICVNPCENQNCSNKGTCIIVDYEATCICNNGYLPDALSCVDENECETDTTNCSENGYCINTEGNYTCECNEGYSGNGFECNDINECELGIDNCEIGFECENIIGSYNCIDINECELNVDNCEIGFEC